MPWVRIDDQYPEHPKIVAAGHLAGWLDVCAMAYSNRALTDGFIAKAMVPRLSSVPQPMKRAAELVAVGRWDEVDGGYQIRDYLDYQKAREQILKEREQAANRQARFRNRKSETPVDNRSDHGGRNAVTNGPVTLSPLPHPSTTVGLPLTSVPDACRDEVAAPERDDELNRAGIAAARAARKAAAS